MIDNCPQSLLEAARYFADLDVCNEYMNVYTVFYAVPGQYLSSTVVRAASRPW